MAPKPTSSSSPVWGIARDNNNPRYLGGITFYGDDSITAYLSGDALTDVPMPTKDAALEFLMASSDELVWGCFVGNLYARLDSPEYEAQVKAYLESRQPS